MKPYFILIVWSFILITPQLSIAKDNSYKPFQQIRNDTINAVVGLIIKNKNSQRFAKTYDRLSINDEFQVTCISQNTIYLYVLNKQTDKWLILSESTFGPDSLILIPDKYSYFQVDGKSHSEKIMIILSSEKDEKLTHLIRSENSDEQLEQYLLLLKNQHKPIISEIIQARINIGGNVRDIPEFQERMKNYKGYKFIIKEYFFDVKK